MGKITLNNGNHVYLSGYNVLINKEMEETLCKYGGERKVAIVEGKVDTGRIKNKISKVRQIIFQTTANCNLRCKYCVYGGAYKNEMVLNKKRMTLDIAIKSMDYLSDFFKGRNQTELAIGFYGGESLIEFELIKNIVAYSKKIYKGKNLKYVLTTNMTLITTEIIDFLIDNNFALTVSLDGPKVNHDSKRVFENGKGSFDMVMSGLEQVRVKDLDYYKKNVSIAIVYSRDLSFLKMYDFFNNNEIVNDIAISLSPVSKYDTTYYKEYPFDEVKLQEETEILKSILCEKINKGIELSYIEKSIMRPINALRKNLSLKSVRTFANTCMFDDRLFIDTEGNFHVCEKINEKFPFGNYKDGFDFNKMEKLVRGFEELNKTVCMDCEIKSLCVRCFVNFAGDGEFKIPKNFCEDKKREIKKNLESLIAFSKLKEQENDN